MKRPRSEEPSAVVINDRDSDRLNRMFDEMYGREPYTEKSTLKEKKLLLRGFLFLIEEQGRACLHYVHSTCPYISTSHTPELSPGCTKSLKTTTQSQLLSTLAITLSYEVCEYCEPLFLCVICCWLFQLQSTLRRSTYNNMIRYFEAFTIFWSVTMQS